MEPTILCRSVQLAQIFVVTACFAVPAAARDASGSHIGAIGQIIPQSGIVDVLGSPGSRVTAIYVHVGEVVKAGTLLMSTQGVTPGSDIATAKSQLDAAKKLAVEEVAAQTAAVRLAESVAAQATASARVYKAMGSSLVSKKELDRLEATATQARLSLTVERNKLRVTKTQTQSALVSAQRVYDLALQGADLRAPIDGSILRINGTVGTQLGSGAAVEMGNLKTMYVLCHVYEGDILHLHPGMRATIRSRALTVPVRGRIEEVGRMIDPHAEIGNVRIRLDNANPADRLVGMEVNVSIDR
ncbi:MAG: efflux RND transporter periplasmic adaptor subunit [Alphaproteobacteria bacterium]|nr:efflux RND transporter periplasmic adaptor subunit [Alphaproteobacteria bacterium]